ncbi:peroxide stress protein YaaA, partial [Thioclava sp. BHET1]
LRLRVVTPVFLEENGKIVSFHAKKARGAMARHVVENRLTDAKDLQGFESGGYRFRPEGSTETRLIFQRIG